MSWNGWGRQQMLDLDGCLIFRCSPGHLFHLKIDPNGGRKQQGCVVLVVVPLVCIFDMKCVRLSYGEKNSDDDV